MQKTYKEIATFLNAANAYLQAHPEENKLSYALKKVQKEALQHFSTYKEELEELRIRHCATDEKGIILRNAQGDFEFTKEELLALNKDAKALQDKTIEIIGHTATELPEDLGENYKEAFTDFVI